MVLRLQGVINLNLDQKNMSQVICLKNMLHIIIIIYVINDYYSLNI